MSRRITFTDFEVEQLVKALVALKKEIALDYAVVEAGRAVYDELIKKIQHSRSVETLDVPGNGDTGSSIKQKGSKDTPHAE